MNTDNIRIWLLGQNFKNNLPHQKIEIKNCKKKEESSEDRKWDILMMNPTSKKVREVTRQLQAHSEDILRQKMYPPNELT